MKKITRRSFLQATGAATIAGALAACSDETGASSTATSVSADVASDSVETQADILLGFGWWGGDSRHEYTETLCEMYSEEKPNISFDLQPGSWDSYWEKIVIQAAGGTLPTVLQMGGGYTTTFSNNDVIRDLTDYTKSGALDVSAIDANLLNTGVIGGKLVGIPISKSARAMIYNTVSLEAAGLDVPSVDWTWADFLDMCKTYTEKTGNYAMSDYNDASTLLQYMVHQENDSLYNDEGTAFAVEYEAFIPFFQLWADLRACGAIFSPDEYVTIKELPVDQSLIATDKALFLYNSNTYSSMSNDHCFLCLPPYSDSGKDTAWFIPGMFYSVATSASEEEANAGIAFMSWLINSNDAGAVQGFERGIPAASTVCDYLFTSGISEQEQDVVNYFSVLEEHGGPSPITDPAVLPEIIDELDRCLEAMLDAQYDAESAAKDFHESASKIFARA